jgi:tol-pal system protein YbgF
MNSKILVFTFTFLLTNILCIINSYAQDNNETITNINERILNRIEGLSTKINDLERKVYQDKDTNTNLNINNDDTSNNSNANHELRLIALEEELRPLKGVIEELEHVKEQIKKLTRKNLDLQSKLDLIKTKEENNLQITNQEENSEEQKPKEYPIYPGMPNKKDNIESEEKDIFDEQKNTSTVEVLGEIDIDTGNDQIIKDNIINKKDNTALSSPRTPEEIYQEAYNVLKNGDYAEAEAAFIEFIKDYSDHSLSSNAYYWLGETFYVRKNYVLAAQNFAAGYQKFPKGTKASAQLLKLGISLYVLKKNTDACRTFKKLDAEFTELPPSISSRASTYKEKLDCK